MSGAWTANRGRGSGLLIRLMAALILRFGRRPMMPLLHLITAYFVVFSPRSRRASREYLARVLRRRASLRDIYRHHWTFAVTLLDRILLLAGRSDGILVDLSIEERAAALLAGGPCVLLGAHVGSFEVLRCAADRRAGIRVRPLMYRRQGQAIDCVFERLNPTLWSEVIPLEEPHSLIRAAEAVQQGASVAVLGDRRLGADRTRRCDFLGGAVSLPEGPLLLAHALQIPVLLCFGLYRGGGRYEVRLERFADRLELPRSTRERALPPWLQHFADRLAATCQRAPYNWFNFYDVWTDVEPVAAPDRADRPVCPLGDGR